MAEGERRMVFDTGGRRKRVVQVVYGFLAIIMGASLLIVIGPFSIADVFTTQDAAESAADSLDDQAANIERKLARNPNSETLLLALTRTRISAGNSRSELDPATGQATVTPEARQEYKLAADAWDRYLRAADEPSPAGAQLAATALFSLAQAATTAAESEAAIKDAALAQQIVADSRPNLGTVSTLAIYDYYAFRFKEGDSAARQAESFATSRAQRRSVRGQLAQIRREAKRFQRQQALLARINRGQGKEQIQNPLGGLSGSAAP